MNNELEIKITTSLEQAISKLDKLIDTLNKGAKSSDKFGDSAGKIGKAFNWASTWVMARRFFKTFDDGIDSINMYLETLNMFHLVMGDLTTQADKFQDTMSKAFGNDTQKQLGYQSYFQTLTESMGLQEKYAYIISENMTKMTYDISSLFDKEQDDVASALRSGLVGQTKPVRNFGMDITESSLQPILEKLGIDRTVRDLNQAEKEIVRYIALLQQSSVAHGDMANTIESPSNQLRVFRNQLIECQRWFSALFINTFAKAMPYINAVVMVIKELCIWLGSLFGIEIKDYNSGIASFGDDFDDLSDSIDGATKSAKELKRQVLGFDQINNINENKDSNSGNNSTVGGIDQRLLDAIKGYDNGMEKVRMKAMDIRDRIMEWLGFTYDTIEGTWKLKDGMTNLKKIGIGIGAMLGGLLTLKLTKKIINLVAELKKLDLILGTGGILKTLKSVVLPASLVSAGIVGLTASSVLGYSSIKKLSKQYLSLSDTLKKSTTGLEINNKLWKQFGITLAETTISGALLGSAFGPIGTLIGTLTGSAVGLTASFVGVKSAMEEIASEKAFGNIELTTSQLEEITSVIGDNLTEQTTLLSNYKNKLSSLETTWNSSMTTLSQYGVMYGLIHRQISEEDVPAILNSIEELGTSTKDIISESTTYSLNLWSGMLKDSTSLTETEKNNILQSIFSGGESMKEQVNGIQDNITKTYQNAIDTRGYLTDEEYAYINDQFAKLREITQIEMSNSKTELEVLQKDINNGRLDLSEEGYNELIKKIQEKEKEANNEAWDIRISAYNDAEKQKLINERAGMSAEKVAKIYAEQLKIADEDYKKTVSENTAIVEKMYDSIQTQIETKKKEVASGGTWVKTIFGSAVKEYNTEEKTMMGLYDKMLKNIQTHKDKITKEAKAIGVNTIQGQIDGMDTKSNDLEKSVTTHFEAVPDTAKKVLDEHSPSKVFKIIGENTIQGYINGLNTKSASLNQSVEKILSSLRKKFESAKFSINISTNIESSLNSILIKLERFINNFRNSINTLLSKMTTSMNSVKVGNNNKLYYTSVPYISVPKFANGGFPEDGLFYANHNELVGQFNNGKTAVANNEQITEGIKRAVIEGMRVALRSSNVNTVKLDIRQDEGIIVKTAIDGINDITRQTGENPIDMW